MNVLDWLGQSEPHGQMKVKNHVQEMALGNYINNAESTYCLLLILIAHSSCSYGYASVRLKYDIHTIHTHTHTY